VSALKGMPLETLDLRVTPVTDLSPLRGAPLKKLWLDHAKVSDISPLAGMPLKTQKVSVPIIVNGKPYGSTDLPVGTTLKLVEVTGQELKVLRGQTAVSIPANATDLLSRVAAAQRAKTD